MIKRKSLSILYLGSAPGLPVTPFLDYLRDLSHVHISQEERFLEQYAKADAVITAGPDLAAEAVEALIRYAENGGAWLHAVNGATTALPDVFGAQPEAVGPAGELWVLFTERDNPAAERLRDAFYVPGPFQALRVAAPDARTVLYTDWHYTHQAVVVRRPAGRGQVACTTLQAFDHADIQHLCYRLLLLLTGQAFGGQLGVGILGYAPSVGRLHGLGCRHTAGLNLQAACDLNPERLSQASDDFPDIGLCATGAELLARPDVDLVIVATPPNTHAELCLQAMAAGKHVVCEKPLALGQSETNDLIKAADQAEVHLSCHQNRRFDPDYLAIVNAVKAGRIGYPFYLETFVGGFWHPCGYWHSHAPVSGGTAYDWGAHYLDWIVALFDDPIESVRGTRHKRVWHDVTNADQERIQIRFHGGREAEFMHSDIAASRKPKWYLLGTEGALVAHWQDVTAYDHDPDLYFLQRDIPATEMPPQIILQRKNRSGGTEVIRPEMPPREDFAFHRNLADHLLTGEPLAAPLSDSIKVVAILEAAARSMANGGRAEVLHV